MLMVGIFLVTSRLILSFYPLYKTRQNTEIYTVFINLTENDKAIKALYLLGFNNFHSYADSQHKIVNITGRCSLCLNTYANFNF